MLGFGRRGLRGSIWRKHAALALAAFALVFCGIVYRLLSVSMQTAAVRMSNLSADEKKILEEVCQALTPGGGAGGQRQRAAAGNGNGAFVLNGARDEGDLPPCSTLHFGDLHTKSTDHDDTGAVYVLELNSPMPFGEERPSAGELRMKLLRSVESLKAIAPALKLTLYTDVAELDKMTTGSFDDIVYVSEPSTNYGELVIRAMKAFPYERMLFVDASMHFCEDVSGVFAYLDNYDLAATFTAEDMTKLGPKLHMLYREFHSSTFNSGLVAMRRNNRTLDLMQTLLTTFKQTPLRNFNFWLARFLPTSDVRVIQLPINYNLQGSSSLTMPILIQGAVIGFYYHQENWAQKLTCAVINKNIGLRLMMHSSLTTVPLGDTMSDASHNLLEEKAAETAPTQRTVPMAGETDATGLDVSTTAVTSTPSPVIATQPPTQPPTPPPTQPGPTQKPTKPSFENEIEG